MGRWGDADARSLVRDSKKWYPLWAGGVMRVKSGNNRNNQLILFMQSSQISTCR
jgi:hypothetical protein